MKDPRSELRAIRFTLNLTQRVYCNKTEENDLRRMRKKGLPLPGDIKIDEHGDFYRDVDTDLSEQEINQLLLYRQTADLRSIKNSMLFFVVLATISLIASLIMLLS